MKLFLFLFFSKLFFSVFGKRALNEWLSINFKEQKKAFESDPFYDIVSAHCTEFECKIVCNQIIDDLGIYLKDVSIIISVQNEQEFSMSFDIQNVSHWKLPFSKPFIQNEPKNEKSNSLLFNEKNIGIKPDFKIVIEEGTLQMKIKFKNEKLFEFFIFKFRSKYLEFEGQFPSENIFGFGERFSFFKMKPQVYTRWNKDMPSSSTDPEEEFIDTYGHHPTILMKTKSDHFGIFFIRTSYPIELELDKDYKFGTVILDPSPVFKFFFSDSPESVTSQYHAYIGKWTIPPFWSLGFHQSKWGYKGIEELDEVFDNYEISEMPIESIWLDLDYMDDRKVFTVDERFFPLEKTKETLKEKEIKLVLLIDPGISSWPICTNSKKFYDPLFEGLKEDIFLKDRRKNLVLGKQWAGEVFYPDFSNPNSQSYWTKMLSDLHNVLPFSGIWLDMNEIGHFTFGNHNVTIEKVSSVYTDMHNIVASSNELAELPIPLSKTLTTKTLSLDTHYHNGASELGFHNFYGFIESVVTHNSLEEILKTKLPFILSRSTAFGSGKYVSHWSGDVLSSFRQLHLSISSIFRFGLFGIPSVGADVCGFTRNFNMDETVEQLCGWWIKVGAFYPFARHHSEFAKARREPPLLRGSEKKSAKDALYTRYLLLRYFYTLFLYARGTGTTFKPLFYNFPNDEEVYSNSILHTQFMIGEELMIAPFIPKTNSPETIYFPKNKRWFSFYNGSLVDSKAKHQHSYSIETPIPIFIQEGKSLEIQQPKLRTRKLGNRFSLLIAFDEMKVSEGKVGVFGNYSLENQIYSYCVIKNCISKVKSSYEIFDNSTEITISFSSIEPQVIEELITKNYLSNLISLKIANSFEIFGLKENSQSKAEIEISKEKGKIISRFATFIEFENNFALFPFLEIVEMGKVSEIKVKVKR